MIDDIRTKVELGQWEFSKHAVDQTLMRGIRLQEIREAILVAEIIEDYPQDKYGPSCLLFGLTQQQRPLHIHCSYPTRPLIKIITVYQPDPQRWNADFTQRRPSSNGRL